MPELEKELEAKVVRYCRAHGIYTRKFVSPGHKGVPDRMFAYGGRIMFLELKVEGRQPTAIQYMEMQKMRQAGILVTWVKNYEDAVYELYNCLLKPCSLI
jgi:hypothetical protein